MSTENKLKVNAIKGTKIQFKSLRYSTSKPIKHTNVRYRPAQTPHLTGVESTKTVYLGLTLLTAKVV